MKDGKRCSDPGQAPVQPWESITPAISQKQGQTMEQGGWAHGAGSRGGPRGLAGAAVAVGAGDRGETKRQKGRQEPAPVPWSPAEPMSVLARGKTLLGSGHRGHQGALDYLLTQHSRCESGESHRSTRQKARHSEHSGIQQ